MDNTIHVREGWKNLDDIMAMLEDWKDEATRNIETLEEELKEANGKIETLEAENEELEKAIDEMEGMA